MIQQTVAITRCETYDPQRIETAVRRQFESLGGIERFVKSGQRVLLKPNFIAPRSRCHATQTHPEVILAVAKQVLSAGAVPFVADSPAWSTVRACVNKLKLHEPLEELGVKYCDMDRPVMCRLGQRNFRIPISRVALEADVIINLPKCKAHQQLGATFAVKNMFGCVHGKRKAWLHFSKGKHENVFCSMLIEIYKYLKPSLTIIDAVEAMDGYGPIHGRTRKLGWLIGGTEPIACERVCCKLIGISPQELPIIRQAAILHWGANDSDSIDVAGDDPNTCKCNDWQRPALIPIRFSMYHVMRSVCKQILIRCGLYRKNAVDVPESETY